MSTTLTRSTCCYCGVGCGVLIGTQPGPDGTTQVVGVQGDPDHPANFGRLCTKGSTLHLSAAPEVYAQTRVHAPELRRHRAEPRHPVAWDTALEHLATRLADIIRRDGPDAVGFYVSGQLLTEDYFVFNKLAKGLIGTNNIDTNSRLCMSSAVAGYKQSLGADAPPCSYEDLEHAGTLFISGSNMAYAHPILFRRIEAAREKNPQQKIIVVDPRVTDTARSADLHLQIQPGTDVALYHGMLHIMLWEDWVDEAYVAAYTEGFGALKRLVHDYTPQAVARLCGIPEADLRQAAQWFACGGPTLSLYCQGLNQSTAGTAKNAALINLHLATGQIGKPGAGPFSLTGQPNAMGGREVGGLANQLAAHRELHNPEHRAQVAAAWGVRDVPEQPGLSAVPMFEALHAGRLKAVWIVCTNPAQSLPHQSMVREALERAELVVVQEAYRTTATVPYADVLLPATTWAEKEGTVTNSERRISRVRAAVPPYAQSRHDWQIAADVGRRLQALLPARVVEPGHALFAYDGPEAVWRDHRELTRGRDLDITGLSYALLEAQGPQQWPMPEGAAAGRVRLYEDGCFPTPSGKARFFPAPYTPPADVVDVRYPFALTTGRLRDQWHGMSRTGTLARLYAHAPMPAVQMNPRDAQRLGLHTGDLVHVASRRASIVLPVEPSEDVAPMQAFIAMHWGEEQVSGHAGQRLALGVNSLTSPALDPQSGQPEFKHAAVKILKADLPWRLSAFVLLPRHQAVAAREHLRPLMREHAFGSVTLFGRETERPQADKGPSPQTVPPPDGVGVLLLLADYEPCAVDRREALTRLLRLHEVGAGRRLLRYEDRRKGAARFIQLQEQASPAGASVQRVTAALLAGREEDVAAAAWLRELAEAGTDVRSVGRLLLSATREPPMPRAARGKAVCTCFNVDARSILHTMQGLPRELSGAQALAAVQQALSCGTNCGSCLPEIKSLIHHASQPIAASPLAADAA